MPLFNSMDFISASAFLCTFYEKNIVIPAVSTTTTWSIQAAPEEALPDIVIPNVFNFGGSSNSMSLHWKD